ncbi:sulfite exporter TauE/SafE family protein [Meiothermus rufus]|uniref:sulfite exporter TauE/SafE family protein n=1 Tax=Meiothermus rufus TaxID=604332 RepID=UPI00042335AF|nr:sulfite exporter TauE/SafE family protein [Meiothermus rufus]
MSEVLIGFFIALTIGLTGVGGGTITAPVLILFLGLPPEVAVGTALLFSFIAKVPAGAIYWARGLVEPRALGLLLLGGIPAVVAGSLLLNQLKSQKDLVLAVIGATIIIVALFNLLLTHRFSPRRFPPWAIVSLAGFIGLEVGFSSAGAGALGTLLLLNGTRLAAQKVVGTDIWFGLALSGIGGGLHAALGQTDGPLLLKLALGGLLGSVSGAFLAQRLSQRPFRIGLLLWLVFIGGNLIYRSIPNLVR